MSILTMSRCEDSDARRVTARNFGRQPNPVFSEAYRALRETIIEARHSAGLSQRELAEGIGKCASHIAMIERGQRRVDALELYRIAVALKLDPVQFFTSAATRLFDHEARARAENDNG